MRKADQKWYETRRAGGLSSGEGLLFHLRDAEGNTDKRLLCDEPELASVFKHFQRQGNILSPMLRTLIDHGEAQTLTKNPIRARNVHLSLIAQITPDELRRTMDSTEIANGLANRFLWLCSKRRQSLPFGGGRYGYDADVECLREMIGAAHTRAENPNPATFDLLWTPDGREWWQAHYEPLRKARPGLLGALVARAPMIILRTAMIFALCDDTVDISAAHLIAGHALWQYAEVALDYLFRDTLGDDIAERVLVALRKRFPDGYTQTQLYRDVFAGHVSLRQLRAALSVLHDNGLVQTTQEGGGRSKGQPTVTWYAMRGQSDRLEQK
jgi:hypothetical protein